MTKTFTPGPWHIKWIDGASGTDARYIVADTTTTNDDGETVITGNLFRVALVSYITELDRANASMIASAPEMLAALKDLLKMFISATEMTDTYCDVCSKHAYKYVDDKGNWTGQVDPIIHRPDCVIGKVEAIIKRFEDV